MKRLFINAVAVGVILFAVSCGKSQSQRSFEQAQTEKEAIQVVESDTKAIIIETLHSGALKDANGGASGIFKVTIDSANTFLVIYNYDALVIERLEK